MRDPEKRAPIGTICARDRVSSESRKHPGEASASACAKLLPRDETRHGTTHVLEPAVGRKVESVSLVDSKDSL